MKIKLPIFFNTDATTELGKIGMDDKITFDDYEQREIIFYEITAIHSYPDDDGNEYTEIHSGHTSFICPLKVDEVEAIVDGVKPEVFIRPLSSLGKAILKNRL